jgi:hypothetical protein
MSTHDINAGKPQNEWVLSVGTVIPLYGKNYRVVKNEDSGSCCQCAFDAVGIGSITHECRESPNCHSDMRKAVGGDSVHFVEVV